jgi:hypothetical protein
VCKLYAAGDEPAVPADQEPVALDEPRAALGAGPQLEDEVERPYPSALRAGDLGLGGPGPRPPHRVRYHRVPHAAHGLKANRSFINSTLRSLKVNFSKQKVKEKNREYTGIL